MFDCKYYKQEISDGIVHEFCSNEIMKYLNQSIEKDVQCIGIRCGKAEKNIDNAAEVKK